MKKALCLVLALVLLAGVLAGCEPAAPNGDPSKESITDTTPSATNPTTPVQDPNKPTAEEDAQLKAYAHALTSLHDYAVGLKKKKDVPITYVYTDKDGNEATATGNQALTRYYNDLQKMESIDKWIEKPGFVVENYGVDKKVFCDRETLLSRFTWLEDVVISQDLTYYAESAEREFSTTYFVYDKKGRIRRGEDITEVLMYYYQVYGTCLNPAWSVLPQVSYNSAGRVNKLTYSDDFLGDGTLSSRAKADMVTRVTYDRKGRITSTKTTGERKESYTYTYGIGATLLEEGKSTGKRDGVIWHYDLYYNKEGRLSKEVLYSQYGDQVSAVSYGYNTDGRIRSISYSKEVIVANMPATASAGFSFSYDTEDEDRVVAVTINYGKYATYNTILDGSYEERTYNKRGRFAYNYGNYYFYSE